jgi:hypothetical protein
MENEIKEKMERFKVLAELLLKEDKRIFIKNCYKDLFFADILFVGEDKITIQCFSPKNRAGKKFYIYWVEIDVLKEYEGEKDE